ncbi:hypothetical protein HNQ50_003421 [Silvimonas terrae]|uniref:Uncharacterized protein n=1 Tax=Silvimonas terrae TaxID=300266 RepID=A0A840RHV6_9NEIS|nr:hypothetical protein [Silvimonas terrae]MBB5192677.1 hypothetical protein [Silvimonas terrae]
MDRLLFNMTHRCGHRQLPGASAFDRHEARFIRAAFSCPHCLAELARRSMLDTRVFVNLRQQASDGLAFVIEVADASDELGELLASTGYHSNRKTLDEMSPGIRGLLHDDRFWSKEMSFASDADPRQVVEIIDRVKLEMTWLEPYLPLGAEAIEYCTFPL